MANYKRNKIGFFDDLFFKKQYGYFLIWGHGLRYRKKILRMIRKRNFISILRILYYKPKSIKRFVKMIYSCDYAPFWHLEGKTRYLLNTKPEVVFIFFCNKKPKEKILA